MPFLYVMARRPGRSTANHHDHWCPCQVQETRRLTREWLVSLPAMTKPDYTANVSEPERYSAVVALMLGTIVSAFCLLLMLAFAMFGDDDGPAGPLYLCLAIFGTTTIVCGWILIRLLRRRRASNGRTVMPLWFIQVFGVLFLTGLCATAFFNGHRWLAAEAVGAALAMIGIRSLLRKSES